METEHLGNLGKCGETFDEILNRMVDMSGGQKQIEGTALTHCHSEGEPLRPLRDLHSKSGAGW